MRILLASASPGRRDLLSMLGIEFDIVRTDVDESMLTENEPPESLVERLAIMKARSGMEISSDLKLPTGCVVIAADTVVYIDGRVLGKPRDREEAQWMLQTLSGRIHEVWTGMAFIVDRKLGEQQEIVKSLKSEVELCRLDQTTIDKYIDSGEPLSKAGAYGLQGRGVQFIKNIYGSYSGVIGLDLVLTREVLEGV
jgi:septum formation protein